MLSQSDFAAKQILIIAKGEKISFKNDNIVVLDEKGKVLHQQTCYRLFAVFVLGYMSLTSGILQRAKKFGFSVILMTPSFRTYHTISELAEGNVILRRRQYTYTGIEAGKALTLNKMQNQRNRIMLERHKTKEQLDAVAQIDEYINGLPSATGIQSVMGYEGSASRVYFKAFFDNCEWKGRKPRIKFDMANALLDIGYTMLFNYVDALVSIFGFDKYVGILHREFYMRKSLVCDLVEPFRVIIDKQVKTSINLRQFKEEDFEIFDGKYCLQYKKSAEYAGIFITALNEYKEEIFVYIRDFYRAMMKGDIAENMPQWKVH